MAVLFSASAAAGVPQGDLLDNAEPGPDGKIDILTVFSHQDDEVIYGGGSVLKAKKDPRVRLYILCMTFDQTSLEHRNHLGLTPDHVGRIRVEELKTAAAVYGAEQVIQFDFHSRTLPRQDPEKLIEEIREVIDRVGAEIVITHDPVGFTGHPDHRACSRAATEAFNRSSARVLYYPTLPMVIYRPLIAFSPYRFDLEPAPPSFKVDVRAEKKLKRLACYAHASQMTYTSVGTLTDFMLVLDHEYFALAANRE
jgi:LmbE family N-acetylglucosaminyl deacetylase